MREFFRKHWWLSSNTDDDGMISNWYDSILDVQNFTEEKLIDSDDDKTHLLAKQSNFGCYFENEKGWW